MTMTRRAEAQAMAILRQAGCGAPVSGLSCEHKIGSAGFYMWRANYDRMDVFVISRMKAMDERACECRWLERAGEQPSTATEWLWTYNHEPSKMGTRGTTAA